MPQSKVSWKSALALAAIVSWATLHGGCGEESGSSEGTSTTGGAPFLVELIVNGDPISVQSGTSTTVTVVGRYSNGAFSSTEPVTWALSPAGFATVDASGLLTGVAAGLTNLTATSATNSSITKAALVNVSSTPPPPVSITTTTCPGGNVGLAYSVTILRINGQAPFAWTLASGSLPAGLTLGASSGIISGVPTTAGSSTFTVRVTDNLGSTDTQVLTIVVASISTT